MKSGFIFYKLAVLFYFCSIPVSKIFERHALAIIHPLHFLTIKVWLKKEKKNHPNRTLLYIRRLHLRLGVSPPLKVVNHF